MWYLLMHALSVRVCVCVDCCEICIPVHDYVVWCVEYEEGDKA